MAHAQFPFFFSRGQRFRDETMVYIEIEHDVYTPR